jgi:ribose 5-phosphate isomerase B
MLVLIAADHAGYVLKTRIVDFLRVCHIPCCDLGTHDSCPVDYPDFAQLLCLRLLGQPAGEETLGILVCGTGIGMGIAANRFKGIRAAVCNEGERSAYLARSHNHANVLCLGARLIDEATALATVETFLRTPFEGGRHQKRLEKIEAFDPTMAVQS